MDVFSKPGRVGTEESATYPLLFLTMLLTPLVCVSTGADEVRNRGGPHETFEAWQENIPVSTKVNWNHCHKLVDTLTVRTTA